MGNTTRERFIEAGSALFWRQGYVATGVKQIVDAAGAPFGSLYHHFPGGKEELGAAAVRRSGAHYAAIAAAALRPVDDPVAAVANAFREAGTTMEASGWADACPIATVALEVSSSSEPVREACAEVFDGWVAGIAAFFAGAGIDDAETRTLAYAFVALLEGAFVLCRAARTLDAMDAAGSAMAALTQQALARSGAGPS